MLNTNVPCCSVIHNQLTKGTRIVACVCTVHKAHACRTLAFTYMYTNPVLILVCRFSPFFIFLDGQLLRKSVVAYSDGVYMPSGADRPSPFAISKEGHEGPPGLGSLRNRTAFLVFFGE